MTKSVSALRDIVAVFGIAFLVIAIGFQLVGDGIVAHMAVVWVANIVMISAVYVLQRRRGEALAALGVCTLRRSKSAVFTLVKAAVLTFLFAIAAFVAGSIVMANITGIPESTANTSYSFLSGNLPMLLRRRPSARVPCGAARRHREGRLVYRSAGDGGVLNEDLFGRLAARE